MADVSVKKRIWGWMSFDWATQPFYTLGLTFIFGPYFVDVARETFASSGYEGEAAKAQAQSIWAWGQTFAGFFIAILGPILGAYADSTGRRMPWLYLFAAIYVVMTWALWWMAPDGSAIWFSLCAFTLGFIAAEFALIFTNAILPSLGSKEEIGRISGNGASLGYWGGVVSLFIMLLFFFEADAESGTTLIGLTPPFGLDPALREGTRVVGPVIAIWFVVFMIPYFLWVREKPVPNRQGGIGQALGDLKTSLIAVTKRSSLLAYLTSSMFYRDGLNALYAFGGVYAVLVLDWTLTSIAVFGIVGAITAAIATMIGGMFDSRFGPKPVITFNIFVLIGVCTTIIFMSRTSLFGITLAEGSTLPDIIFYVCGAAIGGAGGALYAASRSMMVRHTHPDRPTEAFGLFALSGKATAFLAPMLIGIFTLITGSPRLGFAPVILLFLIALVLLRWVRAEGDSEEWSASPLPAP